MTSYLLEFSLNWLFSLQLFLDNIYETFLIFWPLMHNWQQRTCDNQSIQSSLIIDCMNSSLQSQWLTTERLNTGCQHPRSQGSSAFTRGQLQVIIQTQLSIFAVICKSRTWQKYKSLLKYWCKPNISLCHSFVKWSCKKAASVSLMLLFDQKHTQNFTSIFSCVFPNSAALTSSCS